MILRKDQKSNAPGFIFSDYAKVEGDLTWRNVRGRLGVGVSEVWL